MPGGRPRTVCPPPEEMHALGEEMLAYVSDKSNNVLHLSQWWSGEKFITSKVWECMEQAPEFVPYYEKALKIIGIQYLDKNSNVRDGISHRWQRVYFKDLKREEDQDKEDDNKRKKDLIEFEAKLKENGLEANAETLSALAMMMSQLSVLQGKNVLNNDSTSNSTDNKS